MLKELLKDFFIARKYAGVDMIGVSIAVAGLHSGEFGFLMFFAILTLTGFLSLFLTNLMGKEL